jgi:hypothetical protein
MDTGRSLSSGRAQRGPVGRYDKGTAEFFAERRGRADLEAFDRLMRRKGGEPPREGVELPEP